MFFLSSCTHKAHKKQLSVTKQSAGSAIVTKSGESLKEKEEKVQDEKDLLLIRKKHAQLRGYSNKSRSQDPSLQFTTAELETMGEGEMYLNVTQQYQRTNELGFHRLANLFLSRFPKSSKCDEVLYLSGQLVTYEKNYGLALNYFNQVLKNYPYSNKAVSALFAKGAVLRKMNLDSLAKEVFQSVALRYPGSSDASRAQNELRIMNR